jgi:hypothetical protein
MYFFPSTFKNFRFNGCMIPELMNIREISINILLFNSYFCHS